MSWPSNYSVADLVVKHKKQLQPTTMTIARELAFKDMLCHFHVSQAHQGGIQLSHHEKQMCSNV